MPELEIAVTSATDAATAGRLGAHRVELCSALEVGGVTPSIAQIRAATVHSTPVHVLIRPRPGGFVYTTAEVAIMADDARAAMAAGAAGIVVGALTDTGALDTRSLQRIIGRTRSTYPRATVTLHRALDHAADPLAAIRHAAELGIDRVLTSGHAARAIDGRELLGRMVAVPRRPQITTGGGVDPAHIRDLLETGVEAVHLSARRVIHDEHATIPLGSADDGTWFGLDEALVSAARAAIDAPRA